jgi:hypothetical protein
MTLPFRRPRPQPRPRIISVTNHWRVAGPEQGREVVVRDVDGTLVTLFLADDHPALVRFLEHAAAVAA